MPSRWREAWRALLGRSPDRARYQKVILELRAQWVDLLIEIESTLEKLQAVDTRLRKRIERATAVGVAAAEPMPPQTPPEEMLPPKQRARLKARQRGLLGPGRAGNGRDDSQGESYQ